MKKTYRKELICFTGIMISLILSACSISNRKDDKIFQSVEKTNPAHFEIHLDIDHISNNQLTDMELSSQFSQYEVLPKDTLMSIAHKIYGNSNRWRDILHWNQNKILGQRKLIPGTTLWIKKPENSFVPLKSTNQSDLGYYIVKEGETLGAISYKLYNTHQIWPHLWDINRETLPGPNHIFKGVGLAFPKELQQIDRSKTHSVYLELQNKQASSYR